MIVDIAIIGAGASGLIAAYSAAKILAGNSNNKEGENSSISPIEKKAANRVLIIEKMQRAARKIMITGKGRCNITNLKEWNEFSQFIKPKTNFLKTAFYNFSPKHLLSFFKEQGLDCVKERGDRVYPASYDAKDVIDSLVKAADKYGAILTTENEVTSISYDDDAQVFNINVSHKSQTDTQENNISPDKEQATLQYQCKKLIIATGGMSYPSTGSTGDGYIWAKYFKHSIKSCFPALTALVPADYKVRTKAVSEYQSSEPKLKGHIHRNLPLSQIGTELCGIKLKNIEATLIIDGLEVQSEFGDLDFSDGGIEGPIGFKLSRNCVKAIIDGKKTQVLLNLKPSIPDSELIQRIEGLIQELKINTKKVSKQQYLQLLRKLMPKELITPFTRFNPNILTNNNLNILKLREKLKVWIFEIEGYVGYERCVITAGGVESSEINSKTMESKLQKGLYFCGEVIDLDGDTGGYNLQIAFSTGFLAGKAAAENLS